MAVVNKFNVNRERVTLDADIIENMSANDVSYDDSFQYDENTVGDKLSELEDGVSILKKDIDGNFTESYQVNGYDYDKEYGSTIPLTPSWTQPITIVREGDLSFPLYCKALYDSGRSKEFTIKANETGTTHNLLIEGNETSAVLRYSVGSLQNVTVKYTQRPNTSVKERLVSVENGIVDTKNNLSVLSNAVDSQNVSSLSEVNDVVAEIYLTGNTAQYEQYHIYKLVIGDISIQINVQDIDNHKVVAQYYNNDKNSFFGFHKLEEKNDSGIHGYIIVHEHENVSYEYRAGEGLLYPRLLDLTKNPNIAAAINLNESVNAIHAQLDEELLKTDGVLKTEIISFLFESLGNGYLDLNCLLTSAPNCSTSSAIAVEKGDRIVMQTQGTGISCIAFSKDGDKYIQKSISNNSSGYEVKEYVVEEDGYVKVSSRTLAIEHFTPCIVKSERLNIIERRIDDVAVDVEEVASKQVEQIAYEDKQTLLEKHPYYFTEDWRNATSFSNSSYIDSKIEAVPKGKHFIFVTDPHIDYQSFDVWKSIPETDVMSYVKNKLNIPNVICGGDVIGTQSTPYKAAKVLSTYCDEKFSAFGGDFLWCQGNHDSNYQYHDEGESMGLHCIPSVEIYKRTTQIMQKYGKAVFDADGIAACKTLGLSANDEAELIAWMNMHYYYDDAKQKIRYIVLESGDFSYTLNSIFGTSQQRYILWAYMAFVVKAMQNCHNDYDIVVVEHQLAPEETADAGSLEIGYKGDSALFCLLAKFKNHETYTFGNQDLQKWSNLNSLMLATFGDSMSVDFTQKTGRVLVVSGHYHCDDSFIVQSETVGPYTIPTCKEVALTDTVSRYSTLAIMFDRANITNKSIFGKLPNSKTARNHTEIEPRLGTLEEVLFTVVTITDDNKVVCTRIGAGESFEYNLP